MAELVTLSRSNKELSTEVRTLRHKQRTLERSRASYAELFDFAPVTYALLNSVGVIVNVSMAACRLLAVERARMVGHPLLTYIVPSDRREFLDHLRRCRTSRATVESELRLLRNGHEPVTCRFYSKAALYEDTLAIPTLILDETENRALDEARLAAERQKDAAERQTAIAEAANLTKDRFLATVSHELRTPLAPALIAAGRLAAWDAIPETARMLAATIKRNIELEARLIDDLLDIARVSDDRIDLRLETVDLHQVIREAIKICSPLAEMKDVTITMHQIARSHYVSGDSSRLRQVFWNLLNNAIKFCGPHGHITIRSLNVSDELVRVTIRDDGMGMEQPVLDRLFTPFESKPLRAQSRGGLGLGLAICKGIVRAHGGQIWATSDGVGQGSVFGVELATVAPTETRVRYDAHDTEEDAIVAPVGRPVEPPPVEIADPSDRPRVLLIEDDADSSEMLSLFLADEGFHVQVASSLDSGLRELDNRWDIVMSDIKLPDGSGLDVARRAQHLSHPPHRLIALSGFGSSDDILASRDAGFDAHLVKPIDLERLLAVVALPEAHRPQPQRIT